MLMTVETTRKVVKLSLATLLMTGATVMVAPDRADATPVHSTCYPGDEGGYYEWYVDEYGNFSDAIYINDCALERLGAGSVDRARVVEHELGHAQGHDHSSDPSDTMYPVMQIWGI